jgi:hypothetical protein
VVEHAARLRDPVTEQEFEGVDHAQQAPFAPPPRIPRRPGPVHPDTIPWYGDAAAAPARHLGATRQCGKAATQVQRTITPVQHIDQAWDHANGQPSAAWAEPPTAPLAAPIRSALLWARDCPDYEQWVIGQVHYWKRVQASLADATRAWRAGLSSHVRDVLPPEYNGPLHRELLLASGHEDTDVIADIMSGFRMRGVLPDTQLFENVESTDLPDAAALDRALEHALDSRDSMLLEMLQNSKREPDMAEVLRVTQEECAAGKLDGPWEVWLDAAGCVNSTVPFARWLPTRRFPRVQSRTATSYKVRPIDDATASGLNLAVATQERMRMAGLVSLLDAASFIAETFSDWGADGVPLIAKGDHAQAYRQWPVHPDDVPLLVCLVWDDSVGHAGGYRAYAHKALPFGAFGAVWGYTRVAASVNHPLRRIFSVPQNAYVDDFHRASPARWAALHEWVFHELHTMLGIPLKEGKNQGPAAVLDLLGLDVISTQRWAGLRLTAKRRAALSDDVDAALRAQRLSKRDAARLGGQLGFATSAMFGRIGRAYTSPVSAHAGGWSRRLAHALSWWKALLQCPLYHKRVHGTDRPVVIGWVDGSWDMEAGAGAIGGMLLSTTHGSHSFSAHIPPHLCAELLKVGKKQRNTQSELLAVLVLLLTCPEVVRGARLVLFEDNTPALENIRRGAAGDDDSVAIVGAIWLLLGVLGTELWIEWVASESNPADCFSRPDEPDKQAEAAALAQRYHLRAAEPRFPATFHMDAGAWAAAVSAAQEDWAHNDRSHRARTALRLMAVDAGTLAALLAAIAFDADDKQITLGWIRTRRAGAVAAATHFHADLLRLLCLAARPHVSGQGATTVILRKAAWPRAPTGAVRCTATAVIEGAGSTRAPAARWWPCAPAPDTAVFAENDVAIGFYVVGIAGAKERRQAAPLRKLGLEAAGAGARPRRRAEPP